MLELISDKDQTLKEFTDNAYAQASFFFRALLKNKDVKVNGKKTGTDVALKAGDVVCYYLTKKQEEKPAFHIVYEDGNILVVDKESGVNSEAVFAALVRSYGTDCRFIHRLDRNTQGLMVFARNATAESELLRAFKDKDVKKTYHALCFGSFETKSQTMTAYLKKDEQRALVRIYDEPKKGAERIVTEYTVLGEKDGVTKAEITLHTGKTHQIRAHFAHIGHAVVGDMKYGDGARNKERNATRQCLVAKYLSFRSDGELSYLNGKTFVSKFETEL